MQLRYGLLAELEAAPGRGDALAAFLTSAREAAVREEGTVTWYAFKASDTTYGIFDTFASEAARNAHLAGEIPVALAAAASRLLAAEPAVRTIDIVAFK
jgi:quinol monooxygenase YgiN